MENRSAKWSFAGPTAPFYDAEGNDPARYVLRQIADDQFLVDEPFLYDDGSTRVRVPRREEVPTDLASIPFFMAWFVPVNGRHTPAALVHDTMLGDSGGTFRPEASRHGISGIEAASRRANADRVFRTAMASCGVPLLRRNLMYAAVTMATRWSRSVMSRLALALWVIGSVIGSVLLVVGPSNGWWPAVVAASVAPLPAALLWGPGNWRAGALAGYAAWLIGVPALTTALGYGIYWIAEQLLRPIAARASGERVAEAPPPAPYR